MTQTSDKVRTRLHRREARADKWNSVVRSSQVRKEKGTIQMPLQALFRGLDKEQGGQGIWGTELLVLRLRRRKKRRRK
jgi:hypothetical protein